MKKVIGWLILATFALLLLGVLIANFGVIHTVVMLVISISLSCLFVLALDWVSKREDDAVIWRKINK